MGRNCYPTKTINGKKKRMHVLVMEEKMGRALLPHEHVYHLDGNPKNYSIENLVVVSKNLKNQNN